MRRAHGLRAASPKVIKIAESSANATASSPFTLPITAASADGDLALIICNTGSPSASGTWSITGFTEAVDQNSNPANILVAYKTVTAGDISTGSYTVTTTSSRCAGRLIVLKNAAYDTIGSIGTSTGGASVTAGTLTVSKNYSWILGAFATQSGTQTFTAPGDMTEIYLDQGSTYSRSICLQHVNSGSTGTKTATPTGSGDSAGVLISIKPS